MIRSDLFNLFQNLPKCIEIYKSALDFVDWDTLPEVFLLKTKIRNNLSLAYFKQEDFEACVSWAKASLEFDKANVKGYLRMANALVKLKQSEKARSVIDQLTNFANESLKSEIKLLEKQIEALEKKENEILGVFFE